MDQPNKPKFYETEAFRDLEAKWKKRLEREGFEDIEYEGGCLKKPSSGLFITRTEGREYSLRKVHYDSVEEYYRLAGQFFYDHTFANATEKLIWELHKDGISIRNIVERLNKRTRRTYKHQVHTIIQRLEKEMLDKCSIKKT